MDRNESPVDPLLDAETLVRRTLADDLPPDVEARLNARVERFMDDASHLAPPRPALVVDRLVGMLLGVRAIGSLSPIGAAVSVVLLACGVTIHAVAGAGTLVAPMQRMSETVQLWDALRRAPAMRCTGIVPGEFGSSAGLADRVFRHWVLVGSRDDPASTSRVLTFASRDGDARYDIAVDRRSALPRRLVKTAWTDGHPGGRGPAGREAGCTWETPKGGGDEQR